MAGMVSHRTKVDPTTSAQGRRARRTTSWVWVGAVLAWILLRNVPAFEGLSPGIRWGILFAVVIGISALSKMMQWCPRNRVNRPPSSWQPQPTGTTQPTGAPTAPPNPSTTPSYGSPLESGSMPGSWPTDGSYPRETTGYTTNSDASRYQPERSHEAAHSGGVDGLDFPVEHTSMRPDGATSVFGVVNLGRARVGDQVRVLRPGQGELRARITTILIGGYSVGSAGIDQAVELVLTGLHAGAIGTGDRVVN